MELKRIGVLRTSLSSDLNAFFFFSRFFPSSSFAIKRRVAEKKSKTKEKTTEIPTALCHMCVCVLFCLNDCRLRCLFFLFCFFYVENWESSYAQDDMHKQNVTKRTNKGLNGIEYIELNATQRQSGWLKSVCVLSDEAE